MNEAEKSLEQSTVEFDRTPSNEIGGHTIDKTPRAPVKKPLSAKWLFLVAWLVVFADQSFKWWIRMQIEPGGSIEAWPGVVHWSHVWNYGAAWGAFAGARWVLVALSLAVVVAIMVSAKRIAAMGKAALVAASLILGGALGNAIDRIYAGYVVDMIDMDTPFSLVRNFPVFNIADSALTVGVAILLLLSFRSAKQ